MRRARKIWLVVAATLVVIGLIMFAAVMSAYKWDFGKLSTAKYETNTYEISKAFSNLSMNMDTADITFALSDDGKCRVECYEEEKAKHTVIVREDTLVIHMIDEKSWYDYIGISFDSPKITVYLPGTEYGKLFIKESTGDVEIPGVFKFESMDVSTSTGDVKTDASVSESIKINTSTGKICVENVSADTIDLSVSTGHVTVSNVTCGSDVKIHVSTGKTNMTGLRCKNVISDGSTGDISLSNVIATETLSIERGTGDVKFEACDANEIFVETDTGDVTGSLLADKVFIIQTDTGSVDVPRTGYGGRCQITTDTGDVRMRILH